MSHYESHKSSQSLPVYRAELLKVINGANLGDALGFADELLLDDIYRLSPLSAETKIEVIPAAQSPFRLAEGGDMGLPGADLHLDCCVTFMSDDGKTTECLVLVETDPLGGVAQIYVMPLVPLSPKLEYTLVGIDRAGALARFAQTACVSFTGGTMITMANGAQCAVEDLKIGDKVLTRDEGPQEIRWIGSQTVRAEGAYAPISIEAGALNNSRDLVVCPDHRLFIYQRRDHLGAGRSEVLVRARHLVNDTSVRQLSGGFVDYYQMLFDAHQIIYAEGIAAESMLVDSRTRAAIPEEVTEKLTELLPGHRRTDASELEVQKDLLARPDAAALLKRASTS